MNFLDYLIKLHDKAQQLLSLEWSVGVVVLVLLFIPKKYYILCFYLLKLTRNPISFYKYSFDRSRKIKGETFIPQLLNDSYSINERRKYKEISAMCKVRFFIKGEENFQYIKIKIRTSLSKNTLTVEESKLMRVDNEISDFVLNVSNKFFEEILTHSTSDKKRVVVNFDSNKSIGINNKGMDAEMCFITDLNFKVLNYDDFLIEILPFMEDKFTQDEKIKIMANHAAKKIINAQKTKIKNKKK